MEPQARPPLPFKRKKHRNKIRLKRQENGQFSVEGAGKWYSYWRDPYHLMLTIPWWGFIGAIAIAYVLLNTFFAGLYLLDANALTGGRPGSFEDAFFFSVHTLASIGYGVIAPKSTYANIIVTIEAITSLLAIAVVTGLSFARFSKPTARVVFSRYAVVTLHEGVPTLIFRMANERRNQILDAHIKVYLMRDEITQEGEFFYRILDLPLVRDRSPGLMLSWTALHPITPESPLYGETMTSLNAKHTQIRVSVSGTDETTAYTVISVHFYGAGDILFDHQFVDIIHPAPNGDRYVDSAHFHSVVPVSN